MKIREEAQRLAAHVTYGPGAIRRVPALVEDVGARSVLLVCGRRSFEASGAAQMLPDLQRRVAVRRFSDFSPNTGIGDVEAGLAALRESRPDLVLAVGGGSTMDLAKLLCVLDPEADPREAVKQGAPRDTRRVRLFLAPTTSGSGSEATHFAVVYLGEDKYSVASPALLPDHVVLDPELSRTATPQQRAASGVDALCQAIESRWAAGATPESQDVARRALPLLLDHLVPFVTDPTARGAEGMCLGSHLAGQAINISKTTAPHALSYGLTMRHGISHGHAVALTLGPFLEEHADTGTQHLQSGVTPAEHASAMKEILSHLGAVDGRDARRRFEVLLEAIGLERRLTRLGVVDAAERRLLATLVNTDRLANNPVAFDQAGLERMLDEAG